jgi:hypothetical protein
MALGAGHYPDLTSCGCGGKQDASPRRLSERYDEKGNGDGGDTESPSSPTPTNLGQVATPCPMSKANDTDTVRGPS